MSEFGNPIAPAQNIDVRLYDGEFDQNIVRDAVIDVQEKPDFSQQVSYSDLVRFISPGFNNKIVSKAHNYTQDYFELRAQPGLSTGGGGITPVDDILDWSVDRYTPYTSRQEGRFYTGIETPMTQFSRLNYDGSFYAYRFYAVQNIVSSTGYVQTNMGGAYTWIGGESHIGKLETWNPVLRISAHAQYILAIEENKGAYYSQDYSTAFTDHSLVTKKWVTDNVPVGSFIPLSEEPMPIPAEITFTRDIDGKVSEIQTVNSYGTRTVTFTRVGGKVTEIQINNYATIKRRVTFIRDGNGKVTDIEIINLN